MKKKLVSIMTAAVMTAVLLAGCGSTESADTTEDTAVQATETETEPAAEETEEEAVIEETPETEEAVSEEASSEESISGELMIAAAASLENCLTTDVLPMFNEKYPNITVTGSYDSSGKLQTQIEEGAPVDVFFSASTKQTTALTEEGLIEETDIVNLLENKIVLIVPEGSESEYSTFTDIVNADTIAVGDPESVPAGQYAQESLTNLGLWDEVLAKASLGTNVTQVLNWVAEGSADAGIVYATDAAQTDKVVVIDAAPADSVKAAVYPVALLKDCQNPETAKVFIEFLQSPEVIAVFEANGFTSAL
ncbi:MAG TPA: molybdate ABC transporter substrate-binding protein [Lachnospiraceae bacterium]|nr:molybdate ABC transporter substrate-binding protein [Lachnospiraceae bacterium]